MSTTIQSLFGWLATTTEVPLYLYRIVGIPAAEEVFIQISTKKIHTEKKKPGQRLKHHIYTHTLGAQGRIHSSHQSRFQFSFVSVTNTRYTR